jgi:VanZ family protein
MIRAPHKTSAWPLAGMYVVLVVYASLYPFEGWRNQGPLPLGFVLAPWPKYWTAFDLWANVLGYAPLGFLLALGALRTRQGHGAVGWAGWAVGGATLVAGLLSLLMEAAQEYLPMRVASNVDWALNTGGAWGGALTAALLERLGALDRWGRFRARWFVPEARGALVLLALWPCALLAPSAVPLGLGQVYEQTESGLRSLLEGTPWLGWLPPLPNVGVGVAGAGLGVPPLAPLMVWACVVLGVLIPCLLGYCVIRAFARRVMFLLVLLAAALGANLLSAAMNYSPVHAWAWLNTPVQAGLVLAAVFGLLLLRVPVRVAAALLLVLLGVFLSLINQAPTGPYYAHNLQLWEQGRFIRFHGVTLWLARLWPYAVLAYVLMRVWRQRREWQDSRQVAPRHGMS